MSTLDDRTQSLLATPSLEALSYALRHPETWPEGFEWDYNNCAGCAVGLANRLWRLRIAGADAMHVSFKMSTKAAWRIFGRLHEWIGGSFDDITPDHVAAAIDKLLAERQ